jgi:NitT/TauT family transport system ATP-binding protein
VTAPTTSGLPGGAQSVPAIALKGVSKRFKAGSDILTGIHLSVARGELVALVGASGCGKTTLLRMAAGLEEPSEGSVEVLGVSPSRACALRQVGVAFQRAALVPSRTAWENVRLTLDVTGRTDGLDPTQLLRDFGLGEHLHAYPHQLSGGMQQRVNIAAALVHQPQILLLDEPLGALDEITRESMTEWLAGVLARTGPTTLLVTHSVEEAVVLADRVVILSRYPGRIAHDIPIHLPRPRDIWGKPSPEFQETVRMIRGHLHAVLRATGL